MHNTCGVIRPFKCFFFRFHQESWFFYFGGRGISIGPKIFLFGFKLSKILRLQNGSIVQISVNWGSGANLLVVCMCAELWGQGVFVRVWGGDLGLAHMNCYSFMFLDILKLSF